MIAAPSPNEQETDYVWSYNRDPRYYRRALLYHADGKVIFNFSRRVLVGHPTAPRTKLIPRLTEAQAEALDAVHYVAKNIQLKVSMECGDLRLISNLGLLHGREAYSDDTGEQSKRHLIRAWLHNEEMMWKLPPPLQLVWDRTFKDDSRPRRWFPEYDHGPGQWDGRNEFTNFELFGRRGAHVISDFSLICAQWICVQ